MNTTTLPSPLLRYRRPLAACLSLALAGFASTGTVLAAPDAERALRSVHNLADRLHGDALPFLEAWRSARLARAAPPPPPRAPMATAVTNCNDGGSGSLRTALSGAVDGDTVDMSHLSCSQITLTSGALVTHANNVAIIGPGESALTIDANNHSGVVQHYGTGLMTISALTVTRGSYGLGGCITSLGSVALTEVAVNSCTATGYSGKSIGGGVLAVGNVTLTSSIVASNNAYDAAFSGDIVYGGGIFAGGVATVLTSTIAVNTVSSSGNYAAGGGIASVAGVLAIASTISHNTAIEVLGNYGVGGGLFTGGSTTISASTFDTDDASIGGAISIGGATSLVTVVDSTIVGNTAALGGGIVVQPALNLWNSTVALNYSGGTGGGAGVIIEANSVFESSIVANNTAVGDAGGADVSAGNNTVVVSGANNLVMHADSSVTLPAGTLHSDPMLASFLENNGGPTQTLALNANSPAIDAGNDIANLPTDQRGFARIVGAAADIGAYEYGAQGPSDEIFSNGFEQ